MDYSIQKLKTVADCDEKLAEIAKERKDFDLKKYLLEDKLETADATTPEIETGIAAAQKEVDYLEGLIPTIPDGELKDAYSNKLRSQQSKLYSLGQRLENYGIMTILNYEFGINHLQKGMDEYDAFSALVTARKAEL